MDNYPKLNVIALYDVWEKHIRPGLPIDRSDRRGQASLIADPEPPKFLLPAINPQCDRSYEPYLVYNTETCRILESQPGRRMAQQAVRWANDHEDLNGRGRPFGFTRRCAQPPNEED